MGVELASQREWPVLERFERWLGSCPDYPRNSRFRGAIWRRRARARTSPVSRNRLARRSISISQTLSTIENFFLLIRDVRPPNWMIDDPGIKKIATIIFFCLSTSVRRCATNTVATFVSSARETRVYARDEIITVEDTRTIISLRDYRSFLLFFESAYDAFNWVFQGCRGGY